MSPSPGHNRILPLTLSIVRGILGGMRQRRRTMGILILGAALMIFLWSIWLHEPLTQRPLLFILYWMACLWLTCTAVLMALYDLLQVRRQARMERRQLRKGVMGQSSKKEEN